MAIEKSPVNVLTSQSLAAAATKTGTWQNWTDKQAMTMYVKITNGATGPTTRPTVKIEVADNASGTNAVTIDENTTPTDNIEVTDLIYYHAITDRYVRVTVINGTGQAITIEAHAHLVDNLG